VVARRAACGPTRKGCSSCKHASNSRLDSGAKHERLMLPAGAIRAEAQRWWHAELPVQLPARLQTLLMHAAPGSAAKVTGPELRVFPNVHVCNRRCSRMLVGARSTGGVAKRCKTMCRLNLAWLAAQMPAVTRPRQYGATHDLPGVILLGLLGMRHTPLPMSPDDESPGQPDLSTHADSAPKPHKSIDPA